MGYTITLQSSLSIHAGQTWSLVEIAAVPAGELTSVTFALDGNAFARIRAGHVSGVLPVAARKRCRSQSHCPGSQHSIIQPLGSATDCPSGFYSRRGRTAQISHSSSRQFACGHLPATGIASTQTHSWSGRRAGAATGQTGRLAAVRLYPCDDGVGGGLWYDCAVLIVRNRCTDLLPELGEWLGGNALQGGGYSG